MATLNGSLFEGIQGNPIFSKGRKVWSDCPGERLCLFYSQQNCRRSWSKHKPTIQVLSRDIYGLDNELQTRLELARRLEYIPQKEAEELIDEAFQIYKMILSFYNSLPE